MRATLGAILLALALVACTEETRPAPAIDEYFLLVRLHPDPSTRVGEILAMDTPVARNILGQLASVACDAPLIVLVNIQRDEGAELGRAALLVAIAADATDLCAMGGPVAIQPVSYVPGTDPPEPLVSGPLLIEGQTLDGRLPIGRLDMGGGLAIFPVWWEISGRAIGLEGRTVTRDGESLAVRVEDAEAHTVWPVRLMQAQRVADLEGSDPTDPRTMLDVAIQSGAQPDVDADGDGRERFEDVDGDALVDRCVDGDEVVVEGRACTADARFADGYDITLQFRLEPVQPI